MPVLFARRRSWLALIGVGLALAALLPPFGNYARHYVFAESLQFAVFAVVVPGLLALGAPWRALRLSRGPQPGDRGPASASRLADRAAMSRSRRPGFLRAACVLLAFMGACVAWRVPAAVSALARYPGLAVVEMASLLATGTGLWLELVDSPPLLPRITRPQRAAAATLAMWTIWILAYILGFSQVTWFAGYGHAPGHGLSTAADQQIATAVLWAVPALCFTPVIFSCALAWLRDSADPDDELRQIHAGNAVPAGPRGWPRPPRGWHSPSA